MRAVVQRTKTSQVTVAGKIISRSGAGLTVLLGIGQEDSKEDAKYLAEKIVNLRVFTDVAGKMNLSLLDVQGELMVVSQFTLYGDCRKGRRPSFDSAAEPGIAVDLYEYFLTICRQYDINVSCGIFQAEMLVSIENDGPVTLILDSKRNF